MPRLLIISRDGTETGYNATVGLSVMENIRSAGVDELLAICGGCCSCATCHVYIDDIFGSLVKPAGEDEEELLDGLAHRLPTSRLSCQIVYEEAMDGLRVTVAPES